MTDRLTCHHCGGARWDTSVKPTVCADCGLSMPESLLKLLDQLFPKDSWLWQDVPPPETTP